MDQGREIGDYEAMRLPTESNRNKLQKVPIQRSVMFM